MSRIVFGIVIFLLTLPQVSFAGVYKWVDENGVTHFTDHPSKIPKKHKMEELKMRTPPPILQRRKSLPKVSKKALQGEKKVRVPGSAEQEKKVEHLMKIKDNLAKVETNMKKNREALEYWEGKLKEVKSQDYQTSTDHFIETYEARIEKVEKALAKDRRTKTDLLNRMRDLQ